MNQLEELDDDSQIERSDIKRVNEEIKCVVEGGPGNNRLASMSEFLRGEEEQKYGGFNEEEDEEEGSIRDYQNESEGEEEGMDLMIVGNAIKIE